MFHFCCKESTSVVVPFLVSKNLIHILFRRLTLRQLCLTRLENFYNLFTKRFKYLPSVKIRRRSVTACICPEFHAAKQHLFDAYLIPRSPVSPAHTRQPPPRTSET